MDWTKLYVIRSTNDGILLSVTNNLELWNKQKKTNEYLLTTLLVNEASNELLRRLPKSIEPLLCFFPNIVRVIGLLLYCVWFWLVYYVCMIYEQRVELLNCTNFSTPFLEVLSWQNVTNVKKNLNKNGNTLRCPPSFTNYNKERYVCTSLLKLCSTIFFCYFVSKLYICTRKVIYRWIASKFYVRCVMTVDDNLRFVIINPSFLFFLYTGRMMSLE